MATIRKHRDRWQVQIRRTGTASFSRSFGTKTEAQRWARKTEAELDHQNAPDGAKALRSYRLRNLLQRYELEVSPRKRGHDVEVYRLRSLSRHPLADLRLSDLNSNAIARYRDERLATASSDTVRRELGILRHCLEVARREWALPINPNPVSIIRMPSPGRSRTRRLSSSEAEYLLQAARENGPAYLSPVIRLALETAMRRGELLATRWADVDLKKGLLFIPDSKTGEPRTIPLTNEAQNILSSLPRTSTILFAVSPNALRLAWDRLMLKLSISDLRFHDLRHEAISRFFERGLSLPEVALISGHRDFRMLLRYTHLRPEDVLSKLNANG